MQYKIISLFIPAILLSSCYQPQRDCQSFKDGTFTFESIIDGQATTTTFTRKGDLEVDYFNGVADSSSIRWINQCEFIATKLHPKNSSEEQAIHMKILSTTDNSYTFEYSRIGDSRKLRGTAVKSAPQAQ